MKITIYTNYAFKAICFVLVAVSICHLIARWLRNNDRSSIGFKEYNDGLTEIKDTSPETIKALQNILSLDYIEKEELSVELLILADKYEIHPLYKLCQEYLCTAISKENLFDVIKAATFINDEELMSKSAEFIQMNPGSLDIEDNPQWDDFCEENPKCANKILKLMMFKKK